MRRRFCGLGDSFSKTRFLKPEDIVPENYDVTFGMDHPEIMADDELKAQGERKNLMDYDEIVMLGGKKYRPVLRNVFGSRQQITYPLAGYRGIGYMLQALKRAVDEGRELSEPENN